MTNLKFLSLIPSSVPHQEKDKILVFMKHGHVFSVSPGVAKDWLTGEHIPYGLEAYEACGFCWTSLDIWHFETYNFPLPDDFIETAKRHWLDHLHSRKDANTSGESNSSNA